MIYIRSFVERKVRKAIAIDFDPIGGRFNFFFLADAVNLKTKTLLYTNELS